MVPGMIVAIVRGAFAGQMGQVVRELHAGCVMVKLTLTGAVLPFGPSELRSRL
jgi:ribosomal protein L14E/L6E/L27E